MKRLRFLMVCTLVMGVAGCGLFLTRTFEYSPIGNPEPIEGAGDVKVDLLIKDIRIGVKEEYRRPNFGAALFSPKLDENEGSAADYIHHAMEVELGRRGFQLGKNDVTVEGFLVEYNLFDKPGDRHRGRYANLAIRFKVIRQDGCLVFDKTLKRKGWVGLSSGNLSVLFEKALKLVMRQLYFGTDFTDEVLKAGRTQNGECKEL